MAGGADLDAPLFAEAGPLAEVDALDAPTLLMGAEDEPGPTAEEPLAKRPRVDAGGAASGPPAPALLASEPPAPEPAAAALAAPAPEPAAAGGASAAVAPVAAVASAAAMVAGGTGSGSVSAAVAPPSPRPPLTKKASARDVLEGVMCTICQEVLHRAVSINPCLHSFCSVCLGAWLSKPASGGVKCPLCRKVVDSVARNPTVDGLIDGLLKAYPDRRRSADELKDLDDKDGLHKVGYDMSAFLAKGKGKGKDGSKGKGRGKGKGKGRGWASPGDGGGESSSEGGDSDGDVSEDPEESFYSGDEGEALPAAAPCFHCGLPAWRTLSAAAATVTATAMDSAQFVRTSLKGNDFESGVLEEWVSSRGGVSSALAAILAEPNPAGAAPVRVVLERAAVAPPPPLLGSGGGAVVEGAAAIGEAATLGAAFGGAAASPGGASGGAAAPSSSSDGGGPGASGARGGPPALPHTLPAAGPWTGLESCRSCGLGVLRAAVYALRQRIPDGDLPARARGRQDCWYGSACRTQGHRPAHAAKLNHICEQRRFN